MSLTLIAGDSFVSTGVSKSIPLTGGANYFKVFNVTQASTTQATGRGFMFEWYADNTPDDGAIEWKKTDSTNATNITAVTSGGFTYVTAPILPSAPVTGTTISQASQAVAAATNTFSNGDRVRIYNIVGMRQISTMVFTVSSVSGSAFTLPGLDSSGFAAGATSFNARKVAPNEPVLPEYLFITNISQAQNAVIKVSTTHDYVAAMKIRLDIPSVYGMSEANGVECTILSVTAYTITVDMNSSSFTAFSFPASGASVNQIRFATLAPDGQKAYYDAVNDVQYGYDVNHAPFRSSQVFPSMLLAAGAQSPAGSTGDVIEWQAFRYGV